MYTSNLEYPRCKGHGTKKKDSLLLSPISKKVSWQIWHCPAGLATRNVAALYFSCITPQLLERREYTLNEFWGSPHTDCALHRTYPHSG